MKKGYAADFPGSKVYFTEADHSSQNFYGISFDDFDVKIKLWLLLADYTILSTDHMLQSPITYTWLTQNKEDVNKLADKNAILPSLREDREEFKDYIIKDPHLEDQPTLIINQKNIFLGRAEVLSDIFRAAISWSPMAESHWFRDTIVKDLTERDSPLRKRLIGVSKTAIEQLAKDIASCEFLNREILQQLVHKHCAYRERLLLRYGDIFYYLSGALFKDAFPVFHPEAAALCREKISQALLSPANTSDKRNDIWHDIIDTWGLTYSALQKLPLSEIISIRNDKLGKRLRETWSVLMREAKYSKIKEQNLIAFLQSKDKLIELFKQELNSQKNRYTRVQKIRGMLEVGSWVTGGLSAVIGFVTTMNPVAAIATGILGFLAGKPILDSIEKKLPKSELVILTTKIQR